MLAHSPPLVYIHEPFNPDTGQRFTPARFPRQFELVTPETASVYAPALRETLHFYHDLREALRRWGHPRWTRIYGSNVAQSVLEAVRFAVHRRLPFWRPLVKDPIALPSAEWLAEAFGMKVVVLVRSPLGVVSSLLRFPEMITPPVAFLDQPELLKRLPGSYREDLLAARQPIDQAIVQWRVTNFLAALYRDRNPDWIFVRYEDMASEPQDGFRHLCQKLNLPYTARMDSLIADHSSSRNSCEPDAPWILKRNSRLSKDQWQLRLSAEQASVISRRCQDVWERFSPYPSCS